MKISSSPRFFKRCRGDTFQEGPPVDFVLAERHRHAKVSRFPCGVTPTDFKFFVPTSDEYEVQSLHSLPQIYCNWSDRFLDLFRRFILQTRLWMSIDIRCDIPFGLT